jgi:hypothetical protein
MLDLSCLAIVFPSFMRTVKPIDMNDDDLTAAVTRRAGDERAVTAVLIEHLAEFDARRLYEGAGYPSLFQYCVTILRLSEDAAYNRIERHEPRGRFPRSWDTSPPAR